MGSEGGGAMVQAKKEKGSVMNKAELIEKVS